MSKRRGNWDVDSLNIKKQGFGGLRPGSEYAEPKIYQEPGLQTQRSHGAVDKNTDFSAWTDEQIKTFLDNRGGDYDDCVSRPALLERAREVEINTGRAPSLSHNHLSWKTAILQHRRLKPLLAQPIPTSLGLNLPEVLPAAHRSGTLQAPRRPQLNEY